MSPSLDPRLIFVRTAAGNAEVELRRLGLTGAARRILVLIDGNRRLSDMPLFARVRELDPLVAGLANRGLISLVGISNDPSPEELAQIAQRQREGLEVLRDALTGAFERELGPGGRVLEARLADCVSLDVLRQLIREAVDGIHHTCGPDAADRILAVVHPLYDQITASIPAPGPAPGGD